jgi:hypothetical protein
MDAKYLGLGIALLAQLAGIVWWASGLSGEVSHNQYQIVRLEQSLQSLKDNDVKLNTEFRIFWPRGEMGVLPDDVKQNLKIDILEKRVERMEDE